MKHGVETPDEFARRLRREGLDGYSLSDQPEFRDDIVVAARDAQIADSIGKIFDDGSGTESQRLRSLWEIYGLLRNGRAG